MKEEECDAMGRTPSPWVTQAISVGSLLLTTFLLVFHGCCGGGDRSLPHLPCPGPRNSLRWECSVAHGSYPLSSTSHKMTFTWSQAGGPPSRDTSPLALITNVSYSQAQINSQFRHTLSLLTREKKSVYLCFKNISQCLFQCLKCSEKEKLFGTFKKPQA